MTLTNAAMIDTLFLAARTVLNGQPLPNTRALPYAHAIKHIVTAWLEHEAVCNEQRSKPREDTPPGGSPGDGGGADWPSFYGIQWTPSGLYVEGSRPRTQPDPHDERVLDQADRQQPDLTYDQRNRLEEYLEGQRKFWLDSYGLSPEAR